MILGNFHQPYSALRVRIRSTVIRVYYSANFYLRSLVRWKNIFMCFTVNDYYAIDGELNRFINFINIRAYVRNYYFFTHIFVHLMRSLNWLNRFLRQLILQLKILDILLDFLRHIKYNNAGFRTTDSKFR